MAVRPQKTTLAAVALRAGVSTPTVSKVVNGREDVSPDTRGRVLDALEAMGYQSPLHRRAATSQQTVVEVVFDALNSAYAVEVLNGVLECAAATDVEVVVSVTSHAGGPPISPERRAQKMVDAGRSGMIVVTSAFSATQLHAFRRRKIPVAVIDSLNPPPADVVSIGATNWAGGKAAAEHLLQLGHSRIAYLGGPETAECNQARLHGYLSALMAQELAVNPAYIISGGFHSDHGANGLRELLRLPEPPTAVFAASDSIALGVLREARKKGLRVPEDLSLVGFDGTHHAEESIPALTSVSQPLREMGRAALRAVLRQLHGEALDSQRVELATHLVVRGSSSAPQPEAPGIRKP